MGKIVNNGYTVEFKGRVGRHVFRHVKDGSVVAAIVPERREREFTPAEITVHNEFRRAVRFAKRVLAQPATREKYEALAEAQLNNPFALALRDWYRLPTVDEISLARYQGQAGGFIDIVASDDVGLTTVHVAIKHATTQAVLEAGNAAGSGEAWVYTATTTLPADTPVIIEVTAKDGTEHEDKDTRNYP